MTTDRELLEMALEALNDACGGRCNAEYNPCYQQEVAQTLRARLAQPEQEPVAWVAPEFWEHLQRVNCGIAYRHPGEERIPLYRHPPKQEPVIDKSAAKRICTQLGWEPKHDIEAELKERNT